MLATETIAALLTGDPQPAAARLVEEALNQQHPYQDNVTAVILACDVTRRRPASPLPAIIRLERRVAVAGWDLVWLYWGSYSGYDLKVATPAQAAEQRP